MTAGGLWSGTVGDLVAGVSVVGRTKTAGRDSLLELFDIQFFNFEFAFHFDSPPFYFGFKSAFHAWLRIHPLRGHLVVGGCAWSRARGGGNDARSSLPLGSWGSSLRVSNNDGTMYEGRRFRRSERNRSSFMGLPLLGTT